ncbi:hypothetical protein MA16_Dca012500 [Dendrobium catenatum]|uniref:Uncharacterized protein n=1 Tax=Dendrobium catenatum TaxID=906689 RepID=A0A2I0W522_9ASPA|nr:hypothetical protein MA16_Dca012500 [Dendrobium catenatum]
MPLQIPISLFSMQLFFIPVDFLHPFHSHTEAKDFGTRFLIGDHYLNLCSGELAPFIKELNLDNCFSLAFEGCSHLVLSLAGVFAPPLYWPFQTHKEFLIEVLVLTIRRISLYRDQIQRILRTVLQCRTPTVPNKGTMLPVLC